MARDHSASGKDEAGKLGRGLALRGPQCQIWKFGLYPANSGKPCRNMSRRSQGELCVFQDHFGSIVRSGCPPSHLSKQSVPTQPLKVSGSSLSTLLPSHPNLRQRCCWDSKANAPQMNQSVQCQFSCLRQRQCCFKVSDRRVGFSESVTKGDKWTVRRQLHKISLFQVGRGP